MSSRDGGIDIIKTMLPPKEVPYDLDYNEYLKLFFRYQTLTWHAQTTRTSKLMLDKQPPGGNDVPDEAKRKMAVLMTVLEGVIFVRDIQLEVSDHAKTLVNLTASKASSLIDKIEPMKKARTGIVSAFTVLSDTIDETINKTLENHVLPAFGLPVDGIAEGLNADAYLDMSSKYERIGLPEPTQEALELALKAAKSQELKQTIKHRLKTRVASWPVSSKIHTKMLHAARSNLLQNPDQAKEIYEEILLEEPRFEWPYSYLSMIELTDGDLERSKSLLNKAFKLNSNSLKLYASRLRMNLAEWDLSDMEANCSRLDELEPGNEVTKSFSEIIELAKKIGLD